MSVFVKICGLANEADVQAVMAMDPDAMGFVFYSKSPRAVTAEQVADWTENIPEGILKVGVTVDLSAKENLRIADEAGLDVLQLHGSETDWSWCPPLVEIWKVVHLDRGISAAVETLDTLLIDSYTEAMPGGTGLTVDWEKARLFVESVKVLDQRVLLAGGLKAGNVGEAIAAVHPWGVDVSSGVESEPGRKNHAAVQAFIDAARSG